MMKNVISASRRTDIPAFYMDWFEAQIRQGFADVPNPVRKDLTYRVNLQPETVHSIVLWSKNFRPFLDSGLSRMDQYSWYFNFSLVDCPEWEPNVLPLDVRLKQLKEMCTRWSPGQVNWRFDPIVFWDEGRKNNLNSFREIADCCADLGIGRCVVSFVVWYNKIKTRLREHSFYEYEPSMDQKKETVAWMAEYASQRGLRLESCCNDELLTVQGVYKGSCINGRLLTQLVGERCTLARDRSQRQACGCTKSTDIGSYEMLCPHGCLYCYAKPGSRVTSMKPGS